MAKPENPAEASAVRPPRPVQRLRFDALAEGGLPEEQVADAHAGHAFDPAAFDPAAFDPAAFDTARNLETPDGFLAEDGFEAEGAHAEGDSGARHSYSEDDGFDDDAGHGDDAASVAAAAARNPNVEPRPGLAWARRHVSGSWTPEPPNGSANGSASASRVPKLPVASLERPSTSRLELTPSPVPRVALAPATGALDISLVPGPHTIGSRNLPTLAAQHLLGRRAPRRPAPAVTVPPPSSRESRSAFTLARDVRSSKGEIVLGLTIGLGVSLLLAGLGQAYLRGEVIADGSGEPAQLESVTLSARPDGPPAGAVPPGSAPEAASNGSGVPASGVASPAASGDAAPGARRAADDRTVPRDAVARDAMLLARATVGKRTERTPQRATPARAARPRPARRADSASASNAVASSAAHPPPILPRTVASSGAVSPAAVSPGALAAPSEPAPAEPPRAGAPLTPAESAGLGLDLSL